MTFQQHVPAFFDGVEPFRLEFTTRDELLSHPWISEWAGEPGFRRFSAFRRFSIADRGSERQKLMVEMDGGTKWYVLGFIDGDVSALELPDWRPVRSFDAGEAKT